MNYCINNNIDNTMAAAKRKETLKAIAKGDNLLILSIEIFSTDHTILPYSRRKRIHRV